MTAPYDVSMYPSLAAGDRVGVEIDGRIDIGIYQADGTVDFDTDSDSARDPVVTLNKLGAIYNDLIDYFPAGVPDSAPEYTEFIGWVIGKPVYDFDGNYRGIYRGPDVGIVAE